MITREERLTAPASRAPIPAQIPARLITLLAVMMLATSAGACSRGPAFESYRNEQKGFAITHPRGWAVVASPDGARVWFVPGGAPAATGPNEPHESSPEFLLIFTLDSPGPLSDDEARRRGLALLPIHGVSGFRRFREAGGAVWHRFEVTGTSGGIEWASVGLLVTGPKAFQYVVCAKPLPRWRDGQKQCDEILTTFRPGPL